MFVGDAVIVVVTLGVFVGVVVRVGVRLAVLVGVCVNVGVTEAVGVGVTNSTLVFTHVSVSIILTKKSVWSTEQLTLPTVMPEYGFEVSTHIVPVPPVVPVFKKPWQS